MIDLAFYILATISMFFAFRYVYLVGDVSRTWKKMPDFVPIISSPQTTISIIIPARDEEANILHCLQHLNRQTYPANLFETIIVDDDSSDKTVSLVQKFISENKQTNAQLIPFNGQEGKKAALKTGIAQSSSTLIITLDADCTMGANWLSSIAAFYEQQAPKMIIGPVALHEDNNTFSYLQDQELRCLVAFTGAYCQHNRPFLCNGANLIFERAAYQQVSGYEGNMQVASGDDIFLMNKFQQTFPGQISFIKSTQALIYTRAQKQLKIFLHQRIRWASKIGISTNKSATHVGLIVSGINAVILINLLISFFYGKFASIFIILFAIKYAVDGQLLKIVSVFFNKRTRRSQVLLTAMCYPIYNVIILFLSMRRKYEWKGRKIAG